VSTVIESEVEAVDVFPAASVCITVMLQTPSAKLPKLQLPALTVQLTEVVPALLAVTIAVAPASTPDTEIVGVESFVMLSELDLPLSEAVKRSTAESCAGAVVSITKFLFALSEPLLPGAGSVSTAFIPVAALIIVPGEIPNADVER
jgi:hypothetical protein